MSVPCTTSAICYVFMNFLFVSTISRMLEFPLRASETYIFMSTLPLTYTVIWTLCTSENWLHTDQYQPIFDYLPFLDDDTFGLLSNESPHWVNWWFYLYFFQPKPMISEMEMGMGQWIIRSLVSSSLNFISNLQDQKYKGNRKIARSLSQFIGSRPCHNNGHCRKHHKNNGDAPFRGKYLSEQVPRSHRLPTDFKILRPTKPWNL